MLSERPRSDFTIIHKKNAAIGLEYAPCGYLYRDAHGVASLIWTERTKSRESTS
jgi:hypothetical protein